MCPPLDPLFCGGGLMGRFLRKRGCSLSSVCCLCRSQAESSSHIFCFETVGLAQLRLRYASDLSSWLSLMTSSQGSGNSLIQHILNAAILQGVWLLWIERNTRLFQGTTTSIDSVIHHLIAEVKMSYKLMMVKSSNAIAEFRIMQLFGLSPKPPVVAISREPSISWILPAQDIIKINVDGSSFGNPSCGAIGGVFRDWQAKFLGRFAQNIGHASCLEAEFCATMYSLEKSLELKWRNIWNECDSEIVVKAFSSSIQIPWKLKTRWLNCMHLAKQISCKCNHIHREGNQVADALAKNGQSIPLYSSQWWPGLPFPLSFSPCCLGTTTSIDSIKNAKVLIHIHKFVHFFELVLF